MIIKKGMRTTFEYFPMNMGEFIKNCCLDDTCTLRLCEGENSAVISVEDAVKQGILNMRPRMYKALTGCKKREICILLMKSHNSMVRVITYGDVMPWFNKLLNCQYKSVCLNAGIRASDTAFDLPLLVILETGKDKVLSWMFGVLSRNPVTGGCILHEYKMTKDSIGK